MVVFTVKLGVSRLTSTALVEKGRNHVKMLTGNANFTLAAGTLPAITSVCDKLDAANQLVLQNGGRNDHLERNALVTELHLLLKDLQGVVQAQCKNDPVIIASAGFEARKKNQPIGLVAAPKNVRAQFTNLPGEIKARWDSVYGRALYEMWLTDGDPLKEEGWKMVGMTSKNFHTFSGLVSGTVYNVRISAVGTAGTGPVSDYASAKAA
jgi:hypothetical protein